MFGFFRPLNWIQTPKFFWAVYAIFSVVWMVHPFYDLIFLYHPTFDTGMHIQPVVQAVVNQHYWNTFIDAHPFSNHFRPGLFVFAPLIAAFPKVPPTLWAPLAKSIAVLACPLILLALSRRVLVNHPQWVYGIPTFWLFSDILMGALGKANQATGLVLPFILLGFLWAYDGYFWRLFPLVLGISLFKENMPLVGVCLAMFMGLHTGQSWRRASLLGAFSVALGFMIVFWIMPQFGASDASSQIAPFSNLGLKVIMGLKLMLATACLPLLYPKTLLFFLPSLAAYLLIDFQNKHGPFWVSGHYHDYTMAILMVCALFGINQYLNNRSWFKRSLPRFASVLVVIYIGVGLTTVSKEFYLVSANLEWLNQPLIQRYRTNKALRAVVSQIPKHYTIVTTESCSYPFLAYPKLRQFSAVYTISANSPAIVVMPSGQHLSGETVVDYQRAKAYIQNNLGAQWHIHPLTGPDLTLYTNYSND